MSNTDTDVADIFALATDADTATKDTNHTENTPESAPADSSNDAPAALYPKVLRTLKASELTDGENPEGTYTIAEFAAYLTVLAIRAGGDLGDVVKDATIYNAVKGARHPLPVVLVFADDADTSDLSKAKVYLPIDEATAAWADRPTRGEGSNSDASKRSQDDLLTGLAKKTVELGKISERLARTQTQFNKAEKTVQKYHGWLSKFYLGSEIAEIEDTDESGNTVTRKQTQEEANAAALLKAVETRIDEIAAEEDAAKGSDIPDTEKSE